MIQANINTTDAEQFGVSTNGMLGRDYVQLSVVANNSQIMVWDMTEKQAFLLYNRLKNTLGFVHPPEIEVERK